MPNTCEVCGKITSSKKYKRCKSCSHVGKRLSEEHKKAIIRGNNGGRGVNSPSWRGGRRYTNKGYVRVYAPSHPECMCDGYVMEHRLVVEKEIGRFLNKTEVVHHVNGIKDDNRIENLMLFFCDASHRRYERGLEFNKDHILWTVQN